jgi:hypothetical protein
MPWHEMVRIFEKNRKETGREVVWRRECCPLIL